jgi:hypothetical protein
VIRHFRSAQCALIKAPPADVKRKVDFEPAKGSFWR